MISWTEPPSPESPRCVSSLPCWSPARLRACPWSSGSQLRSQPHTARTQPHVLAEGGEAQLPSPAEAAASHLQRQGGRFGACTSSWAGTSLGCRSVSWAVKASGDGKCLFALLYEPADTRPLYPLDSLAG